MSELTSLQKQYGPELARIARTPAFLAAMQYLNAQKMDHIAALSDMEIAQSGVMILADLRGHLQHENELMTLHLRKDTELPDLGEEQYPDPIEEAAEQTKPKRTRK